MEISSPLDPQTIGPGYEWHVGKHTLKGTKTSQREWHDAHLRCKVRGPRQAKYKKRIDGTLDKRLWES